MANLGGFPSPNPFALDKGSLSVNLTGKALMTLILNLGYQIEEIIFIIYMWGKDNEIRSNNWFRNSR